MSNSESTYGDNLPHYTPSLQKFVDLPAFGSRYLGFVCCLSNRNCILTCGPSKKKGDSSSTFSLARRSRMESILWTLDNCICRGWHFRSVDVFLAEHSSPKHIKKKQNMGFIRRLFLLEWMSALKRCGFPPTHYVNAGKYIKSYREHLAQKTWQQF